jgi:hypothetical protein
LIDEAQPPLFTGFGSSTPFAAPSAGDYRSTPQNARPRFGEANGEKQ